MVFLWFLFQAEAIVLSRSPALLFRHLPHLRPRLPPGRGQDLDFYPSVLLLMATALGCEDKLERQPQPRVELGLGAAFVFACGFFSTNRLIICALAMILRVSSTANPLHPRDSVRPGLSPASSPSPCFSKARLAACRPMRPNTTDFKTPGRHGGRKDRFSLNSLLIPVGLAQAAHSHPHSPAPWAIFRTENASGPP